MSLYTKADVATQLKISERSVERLVRRGDLAVTKIGTCARFTQDSIDSCVRHLTKRFGKEPKDVISAELAKMGRLQ